MWHLVRDLSSEQRIVIESLLGRRLQDDEGLDILPSRMLKEAPAGEERTRAYRQYLDHLDMLSGRVEDVSDAEIEEIVSEACDHARHPAP